MFKHIATALFVGLLSTTPAVAGNGTFVDDNGTKVRITCKNSGCTVRQKAVGGKWAILEKGKGGNKNYRKLKAKYAEMGYK